VLYQVSTDLLFNPLIVQFVDPGTGKCPSGLSVEVVSSEFSGVYTLDGQLSLKPVEGILPLGVLKDELRGVAEPLSIQLHYSAPGYPEKSQAFLVRDTLPRLVMLSMDKGSINPQTDNLAVTCQLNTPEQQEFISDQRTFSITWPEQTRLLANDGTVESGFADLKGAYYPNTMENQTYLRERSIGQTFTLYDGSQKNINIEPLGLLSLSLEHRTARNLLYPVVVSVALPDDCTNRLTGKPLRAGDRVPVLSYITENGTWTMAGFANIVKDGSRLRAITHQQALRPLAFGWPSFSDPAIASECILLLSAVADVSEPYTGVYRRDYVDTIKTNTGRDTAILIKEEVFFSYADRPQLAYAAVFPNCAAGSAQGLDRFIAEAKSEIQAYFSRQDSGAFQGVRFDSEAELLPILRPGACFDQMITDKAESITLVIEAQSKTDGFLSYQYANVDVEEYVCLEEGRNEIYLPFPEEVFLLNTGATFGFSFHEQCARLSDGITTDLCALQEGFSFNINTPFQKAGLSLTLKGETACNNPSNTNTVLRPTVPVLAREHCPERFSPYRYVGQLTNGEFHGKVLLDEGKAYDFMMPIGESYTSIENITLEAGRSYRRGNNSVFVTTGANADLSVDLGVIDIPDAICELLTL